MKKHKRLTKAEAKRVQKMCGGGQTVEHFENQHLDIRVLHMRYNDKGQKLKVTEVCLECYSTDDVRVRLEGHVSLKTAAQCLAQFHTNEILRWVADVYKRGHLNGQQAKAKAIRAALEIEELW